MQSIFTIASYESIKIIHFNDTRSAFKNIYDANKFIAVLKSDILKRIN